MNDKVVRAQYTQEFRLEAVRQVQAWQSISSVGTRVGKERVPTVVTACRWRPTWCNGASTLMRPTSYGVVTSRTSIPKRAGCTWSLSSTCSAVRWWAGACSRSCRAAWSRTRWLWHGGGVDHPRD